MAVLRALARPLLASIFIVQGYDTLRQPERVSPAAEPVVGPVRDRVPIVPDETEQAVRINGAVQLIGGSLLALGWWPRIAAAAIAGSLVPTTLAGHRFWEVEDEQQRAQQRIHFLKNLTMLGGLLIAAVDTEGNPSLAWQARHVVKAARHDVALATKTARASGRAGARVGKAQGKAELVRAKADTARAKAETVLARAGMARVKAGKAGVRKTSQARAKAGQLSSLLPVG
jgi:putative oxidoreductase